LKHEVFTVEMYKGESCKYNIILLYIIRNKGNCYEGLSNKSKQLRKLKIIKNTNCKNR